jgi:IS605 OrfB family transposase
MIRSTKLNINLSNKNKLEKVKLYLNEYKKVTQFFVDYLWNNCNGKIPNLIPKEITSKVETWLSARSIQASAKQASGIVRGTRKKHESRLFILDKLNKEGKYKKARKLASVIKNNPINKPELTRVEAELDERFFKIENSKNSFDSWITLTSLGNKLKIKLPINFHKKFNALKEKGKLLKSIRLSENSINVSFEILIDKKLNGKTIGVDIGIKTAFTSSDGNFNSDLINGHDIDSVCKRISRRKKGSKRYNKSIKHRTNLIGYYKNKLDWENVKEIKIENIKNLKYKRRISKYLNSFVYREFFEKLEQTAELFGVQITKVCPIYTSQRCSCCGWTRKSNRIRKLFKCGKCNYIADADFNGAKNISFNLRPISQKERQSKISKTGFYWN